MLYMETAGHLTSDGRLPAAVTRPGTNRAIDVVALDEACTSRGRMETMPPRATVHSTAGNSRVSFWNEPSARLRIQDQQRMRSSSDQAAMPVLPPTPLRLRRLQP